MTVHDKAHELAKAIKNSGEYKNLAEANKTLLTDETAKKMVKDFFSRRVELEAAALSGQEEDQGKVEQLKKIYELINLNSKARDFLNAQMRLMQIVQDVHKILGEALADVMEMDLFDDK